ncbi:MAG: UGSC family (seleno)protein, partial [Dehalococcoidia bacterium]
MIEKAGKPTVGILSRGFEADARATARAFGLPSFRFAVVPDVLTSISPERIREEVEEALPRIIEVLTTAPDGDGATPTATTVKPAARERFQGTDRYEAFERFDEAFLSNGYGDGFPLAPPTEERVAQMLRGTTQDPQDVVSIMTPGSGIATVEKIAINAAMAGCQPAHLPVVIAAVEAFE